MDRRPRFAGHTLQDGSQDKDHRTGIAGQGSQDRDRRTWIAGHGSQDRDRMTWIRTGKFEKATPPKNQL